MTELKFACSVCCHMSINVIDHLGELIRANASAGSTLSDLRLHRTKCSRLIDYVLSPSLREELQEDVKNSYFSILADESTDISVDKNLCICIKYYSKKTEKMETAFLGLFPVVRATGEALFSTIKEAVNGIGLELSNCVGLGCDGANNMVGEENSVWSRMRDAAPHCLLFKCVCHSLALCVQKAFNKMPSSLGFLLSEVAAWFNKSTLRREQYKAMCREEQHIHLFDNMDVDEDEDEPEEVAPTAGTSGESSATATATVTSGATATANASTGDITAGRDRGRTTVPMPFTKASMTRWLVRGKLIKNLLLNWSMLKSYYGVVAQVAEQKIKHKAKVLHEILSDGINFLYMTFLSPIVKEFDQANIFFQSSHADPEAMVMELGLLHRSLRSRIKDNQGNNLALSVVDFGASFSSSVERMKRESGHHLPAFLVALEHVKGRCQVFLHDLLIQVENRLPVSMGIFRGLTGLHPKKVLSQTAQLPFEQLPGQHLMQERDLVEIQYRKILFHPWREEDSFSEGLPKDAVGFWSKVLNYARGDGVKPYEDLAQYALAALSVPVSNAVVERIFSHVTIVKTKYRNKMQIKMLDSILRVRLSISSGCCKNFLPTKSMIKKFNSAMYVADKDVLDLSGLE
jgi:hypothetical protein